MVGVALNEGIPVFSFPPHAFGMSKDNEFSVSYSGQIRNAIKFGLVPVIYGDIVMDSSRGVSDISTEEVLRSLSYEMRPDVVVISTDVNGLFTKNPKTYPDAELIKFVDSGNITEALSYAGESLKIDSTGGMRAKVLSLYKTVHATGSTGYIVNANEKGALRDVLLGKDISCTIFRA